MEATILKWHKAPGDKVAQDETILDIATDKVDSEVPSTAEGIIEEILYKENADGKCTVVDNKGNQYSLDIIHATFDTLNMSIRVLPYVCGYIPTETNIKSDRTPIKSDKTFPFLPLLLLLARRDGAIDAKSGRHPRRHVQVGRLQQHHVFEQLPQQDHEFAPCR